MALFDPLKLYNFTWLLLKEIKRLIETKAPIEPLQFKDESITSIIALKWRIMKITLVSIFPDLQSFGIRTISACLKKDGHDVDLIFFTERF